MQRTLVALSLYLGTALFFAVCAIALLSGVSLETAAVRGLTGLAVMGGFGLVAGAVSKPADRSSAGEQSQL